MEQQDVFVNKYDLSVCLTCGFKSFFSCAPTAGVEIWFTVPKALRPDGRGVLIVLALSGFRSFSDRKIGERSLYCTFPPKQIPAEKKKKNQVGGFTPGAD